LLRGAVTSIETAMLPVKLLTAVAETVTDWDSPMARTMDVGLTASVKSPGGGGGLEMGAMLPPPQPLRERRTRIPPRSGQDAE
jgi:hypothetical protein